MPRRSGSIPTATTTPAGCSSSSRGDFFLCSSEEQRVFYLGFLTALGRVNPERLADDPDLRELIAPVPFGVPEELPPHRPVLPAAAGGERRLLFGGLYDWYDPWTLARGARRAGRSLAGRLFVIRNPNAGSTPQRLLAEVEARCRQLGWWGSRVQVLDWVPAERRYDLLRDVDLLVAPHRPSLETRLSLRTRFLDALAAGCPVVTSEGGTIARLLREQLRAGWCRPATPTPWRRRCGRCWPEMGRRCSRAAGRSGAAPRLHLGRGRSRRSCASAAAPPRRAPRTAFAYRPATLRAAGPHVPFRLSAACALWAACPVKNGRGRSCSPGTAAHHLETCLRRARRSRTTPASSGRSLVLDNGSTDGTAEWVRAKWPASASDRERR